MAQINVTDGSEQPQQDVITPIQPIVTPPVQPAPPPPVQYSEPPLDQMVPPSIGQPSEVVNDNIPHFGALQPKVDAHPLFSGASEPKTKNRRWMKRTLTPLIALFVVLVVLYLGMDAGIVKGYSHLPFHFFKAPVAVTTSVITPVTKATQPTTPTTPIATDPYAGWKTYTTKNEKLMLKYPSSWTLMDATKSTSVDNVTLTSGDGYVLSLDIGAVPGVDPSGYEMITTDNDITFLGQKAELAFWTGPTTNGVYDKTSTGLVILQKTNSLFTTKNIQIPPGGQSDKGTMNIDLGFGNNKDGSPIVKSLQTVEASNTYKDMKLIIESMTY